MPHTDDMPEDEEALIKWMSDFLAANSNGAYDSRLPKEKLARVTEVMEKISAIAQQDPLPPREAYLTNIWEPL